MAGPRPRRSPFRAGADEHGRPNEVVVAQDERARRPRPAFPRQRRCLPAVAARGGGPARRFSADLPQNPHRPAFTKKVGASPLWQAVDRPQDARDGHENKRQRRGTRSRAGQKVVKKPFCGDLGRKRQNSVTAYVRLLLRGQGLDLMTSADHDHAFIHFLTTHCDL